MASEVELKHVVVHKHILNEFNVTHCGIKIKVIIALAKFNHLTFQITSRWLFIAESEKVIAKDTKNSSYTVWYGVVAKLSWLGSCFVCS